MDIVEYADAINKKVSIFSCQTTITFIVEYNKALNTQVS